MITSGFTFGAHSAEEFGLFVQHRPKGRIPARRVSTFTIPGRNGVLHQSQQAWNSISRDYDCYIRGNPSAHAIKDWLCASTGPQRLWDVYDPDYYYRAVLVNAMEIENILNRYGRVKLKFDCDPRAFLVTGDTAISFTAAGTIVNPTVYDALPIITITGSGGGSVTVGGVTVIVLSITDQLTLDCELMDAYRQVGDGPKENKNSCISAPVFPALKAGSNAVSWTGGITGVSIIPRWWRL